VSLSAHLRRYWLAIPAAIVLLGAAGWAALAPVTTTSRDWLFEIPKGTWARRMAGNKVDILPPDIRLTLGIRDILVLKNLDDVPQVFGSILLMPGQSFRLPFEMADPKPLSPWARLRWRAQNLWSSGQWQ